MGNDISIFKDDDDDLRAAVIQDEESEEEEEEEELELKRGPRVPEYAYKVVIVGRPESGKTALINRFIKGTYTEAFQSENRDVRSKVVPINDNLNIRLNIWDILPRTSYLTWFDGAQGAIVVYDCATPSELDSLKWKQELDSINRENPFPIALVATKCDEKHTKDPQLDKFVKDYGFIGRYDTSAKLDENVTHMFNDLIQHMIANDPRVTENQKPDLVPVPAPTRAPPSPLTVPVQVASNPSSRPSSRSPSPTRSGSPNNTSNNNNNNTTLSFTNQQSGEATEVHEIPTTKVKELEQKAEDMYVL